jgi:hypothetical protein
MGIAHESRAEREKKIFSAAFAPEKQKSASKARRQFISKMCDVLITGF